MSSDPGRGAGDVDGGAGDGSAHHIVVRQALPADARRIHQIVAPSAAVGSLVDKGLVSYFESIQEFVVAEIPADGRIIGCGALHVLWDDIAEVRTIAVDPSFHRRGVGHQVLDALLERARLFGLARVFCLTFEVEFFSRHGFVPIAGTPVGTDVYAELRRSHDEGVAEFLELARVKPNTLGNMRMLLEF